MRAPEVGGDERGRRIRDRFVALGPGDSGEHQRERHAEHGRERTVGRRAVADHHDGVAVASVHQRGHRRFGLPRDLGPAAARGLDRGHERARAREQTLGRRDRSGRGWWRRSARPDANRVRGAAAAVRSRNRGANPTTTASARARPSTGLETVLRASASTTPGPAHASTRLPGGRRRREQRGRGLGTGREVVGIGRRHQPPPAVRRCRAPAHSSCW